MTHLYYSILEKIWQFAAAKMANFEAESSQVKQCAMTIWSPLTAKISQFTEKYGQFREIQY